MYFMAWTTSDMVFLRIGKKGHIVMSQPKEKKNQVQNENTTRGFRNATWEAEQEENMFMTCEVIQEYSKNHSVPKPCRRS